VVVLFSAGNALQAYAEDRDARRRPLAGELAPDEVLVSGTRW
jgi:hypothetical protein